MTPKPGIGFLHWNWGGWFGSQVGGSCSLVAGAVVLAMQNEWRVALVFITCGILCNAIGTGMWRHRDVLPPYSCCQCLIAVCGLCTAVCFLTIDVSGIASVPFFRPGDGISYWLLLVFPALMLQFAFLEWARRREMRSPPTKAQAAS